MSIVKEPSNTADYYEHSQWTKKPEFLQGYKTRSKIESKNSELKRFHGLHRAYGYGIGSVAIQVKLGALAADLKQIVAIRFSPAKDKTKGLLCAI